MYSIEWTLPVPWSIVEWRAIEGFHCCQ